MRAAIRVKAVLSPSAFIQKEMVHFNVERQVI